MERFGLHAVLISGVLGLMASSQVLSASQDLRTIEVTEHPIAKASMPAEPAPLNNVPPAAEQTSTRAKEPTKSKELSKPKRSPDLLPRKEAEELEASAKTPADHTRLSKHYTAQASQYEADARRHLAMAFGYRSSNRRGYLEGAAVHCDRLAQEIREKAALARDLAAYHAQLAT